VNFLVFAIHMSSSLDEALPPKHAQLRALLWGPARLRGRVLRKEGASDAHRTGRGRAGDAFQKLASREFRHVSSVVWGFAINDCPVPASNKCVRARSGVRRIASPARKSWRSRKTAVTSVSPTFANTCVSAPVGSTTTTVAGKALLVARQGEVLRPRPQDHVLPIFARHVPVQRHAQPVGHLDPRASCLAPDPPRQEIHRGRADEPRDEEVRGPVVELERLAALLDHAVAHHDDLVGHRHRLDLVVSHVHRRRLEALVQLLQLGAHRHPQLGVEVGERLVEEEDLRVAHDAAPHRDALPLAAGKLARIAVEQVGEPEDRGGLRHARVDLGARALGEQHAEGHVVAHLHVRVERVVLEDHGDVALLRRHVVHDLAADLDLAAADLLEPRDHAQQRRLAAPRGADQHRELAVGDVDVDAADHVGAAEVFMDVEDVDGGHLFSLDDHVGRTPGAGPVDEVLRRLASQFLSPLPPNRTPRGATDRKSLLALRGVGPESEAESVRFHGVCRGTGPFRFHPPILAPRVST
jgi:hypothetical protein